MAIDRLHLLLYRALLLTTAVVAAILGIAAGLEAPTITPEFQLTGYWRAYGLLVFAALSAYLGATPPGAAVLWLVVIFHKASMTMTAVLLLRHDVTGAPAAALIDGVMVLATLVALGLRAPAARARREARESRAAREGAPESAARSDRSATGTPATRARPALAHRAA
ncbi:hypothetical protein [Dietzia aurantiaca]|uniref:DUF4345 domain-containing protein n=1 Tax=Dietzia aurantiaca TaxID=983873 RepID=A0ABV9PN15_9ACTN